jgi:hypothetical protein
MSGGVLWQFGDWNVLIRLGVIWKEEHKVWFMLVSSG